ncbi:hypothetical protein B0H14DRAFT_2622976 [Mycena olivaceomarginata]|nr:hypothetical protein B0H14DRAFT_2622976 [Mycena olivaceomarginata]
MWTSTSSPATSWGWAPVSLQTLRACSGDLASLAGPAKIFPYGLMWLSIWLNSPCTRAGPKLSLDFCVSVALLRAKVQESPGQDYWSKVDEYLEQVRVKKDNNTMWITEVFGQIYDQDILQLDVKLDRKELEALSSVRPEVFVDDP